MSATETIRIEPDDFDLDAIFARVESFAAQEGWASDLTFRVNLSLEELTLNTITHGRHEELEAIKIILESQEDLLKIEIIDNGLPFNPLEGMLDPGVDDSLEDRAVGGLGVHLVHSLMDKIEYKRAEDRNHVTLIARRAE